MSSWSSSGQPHRVNGSRRIPRHLITLAFLVIVALLVSACGTVSLGSDKPTATPQTGPTPKSVSLTVSDLPKGFTQSSGTEFSTTNYTTYSTTFVNHSTVVNVRSKVLKTVNVKGAKQAYSQALQKAHMNPGYTNTKPVSGLGDEATAGSYTQQADTGTIESYGVAFRQGIWAVTVTTTGGKGKVSEQQVLGYAHTISGNISSGK